MSDLRKNSLFPSFDQPEEVTKYSSFVISYLFYTQMFIHGHLGDRDLRALRGDGDLIGFSASLYGSKDNWKL